MAAYRFSIRRCADLNHSENPAVTFRRKYIASRIIMYILPASSHIAGKSFPPNRDKGSTGCREVDAYQTEAEHEKTESLRPQRMPHLWASPHYDVCKLGNRCHTCLKLCFVTSCSPLTHNSRQSYKALVIVVLSRNYDKTSHRERTCV